MVRFTMYWRTYKSQGTAIQDITTIEDLSRRTQKTQSVFLFSDLIDLFCVLCLYALGREPHAITKLHDHSFR